jgi:hypothetical protein
VVDQKSTELKVDLDATVRAATDKIDRLPGWNGVYLLIGAIFTAVGLVFTLLAFGGDRFDGGMAAALTISDRAELQAYRDEAARQKPIEAPAQRGKPPSK